MVVQTVVRHLPSQPELLLESQSLERPICSFRFGAKLSSANEDSSVAWTRDSAISFPLTAVKISELFICQMALTRPGDYLGMLSSTVAHPYRKTMTPTREAGISICVYRPNQAKYRAIFSPKYFLNETKISNVLGLISSEHGQNERILA